MQVSFTLDGHIMNASSVPVYRNVLSNKIVLHTLRLETWSGNTALWKERVKSS